jgi:hypothetical protein
MTDKQLSPAAQAVIKKVQATLPDYMISDRTAGFFAAAAFRELVFQLQYYNCLEGEDMLLDARAVLDIADELEGK